MIVAPSGFGSGWPTKPIRLVVPYPAGGALDIQTRLLANHLSLGQNIIVDNRTGAGGNIGTMNVIASPSDGYTLLMSGPGIFTINKLVYRDVKFDPETDLIPISIFSRTANVLVVSAKLPYRTVEDLLAYLRTATTPTPVAVQSMGSTAYFGVLALEDALKVRFNRVNYRGSMPALQDLRAGTVPFMITELPSVTPFLKDGSVIALAVTTAERWPLAPGLRALAEVIPGFESSTWFVIAAPKNTPDSVVEHMRVAIDRALATPALIESLNALGAVPVGGLPGGVIKAEATRWRTLAAASGLQPE
jgi:tripartite-type tricarboxylate transporter receptor subunit TctC